MNMETKVMIMSVVMRVYVIFWIIISAYGMQNECNNSLGVPKLDVNRITLLSQDTNAIANRGNLRLSDEWPVLVFIIREPPRITIDLENVYNITGMIIKGKEGSGAMAMEAIQIEYGNYSERRSMVPYSVGGEYPVFAATTAERNIRYHPFNPPFIARYVALTFLLSTTYLDNKFALQIDFLGCNITGQIPEITSTIQTTEAITTAIPCNDILKTSFGNISRSSGTSACLNSYKIQIKFDEGGLYQITSVNITITNDDFF